MLTIHQSAYIPGTVYTAAFHPNGSEFYLSGPDLPHTVMVYDSDSCKLIGNCEEINPDYGVLHSMCLLTTTQYIIATYQNSVVVWDINTKKKLFILEEPKVYNPISHIAISPCEKILIAMKGNGTSFIVNMQTRNIIGELPENRFEPSCIVFSPDGTKIAASYIRKNFINVWNVSPDAIITHSLSLSNRIGSKSVSFSADSTLIAAWGDISSIFIWNSTTGEVVQKLLSKNLVFHVAFNPIDSNILASGDTDGSILLWNVKTGQKIETGVKHNDNVLAIVFSADGNRLLSSSRDNDIIMTNTRKIK